MLAWRFISFAWWYGVAQAALAQDAQPPVSEAGQNVANYNPLTTFQMWACILCVVIGAMVFAGQFLLLRRTARLSSDDIIKNCTITLVVIGALILIVAGYDSQQTAQAFGLFGTVIGYLLGRSASRADQRDADELRSEVEGRK